MKRYLVFSGDSWYPKGGWQDFDGSFDTLDEAYNYIVIQGLENSEINPGGWCHIVDSIDGKIVIK